MKQSTRLFISGPYGVWRVWCPELPITAPHRYISMASYCGGYSS